MNDPLPKSNSTSGATSTSSSPTLSRDGQRRRSEMLGQLEGEMHRFHDQRLRRKRFMVTGCVSAALVFAAGLFFWQFNFESEQGELVLNSITCPISEPIRAPNSGIGKLGERVSNNVSGERLTIYVSSNLPDVAERLVHKPADALSVTKFETIEDDELLDMLHECGKPAILGMIDGRKTVVIRRSF